MALPWNRVIKFARTRRRIRRDKAKRLRDDVRAFKEYAAQQGWVFATDRDAWEQFRVSYPDAHVDFAGSDLNAALAEVAFRNWRTMWNGTRSVDRLPIRTNGNAVTLRMPELITVGVGEVRKRINPMEVLAIKDEGVRADIISQMTSELPQEEAELAGKQRLIRYKRWVIDALKNGVTAIRDPEDPEGRGWLVQGALPEPADVLDVDIIADEDTGDDDTDE